MLGVRERSPHPGLQLEAGQAFIQGRNESQVLDHVLFADFFGEHTAVRAVRDEIAEDVDGEVNAPGAAGHGHAQPMPSSMTKVATIRNMTTGQTRTQTVPVGNAVLHGPDEVVTGIG